MRLKNKHTGEIVEVNGGRGYLHTGDISISFSSLEQLNSTWEDIPEELKDYWYINALGDVIRAVHKTEDFTRSLVAIGNNFETPEEAEKAVEKLKAIKRLKDYNVKFNLDFVKNKIDFTYSINNLLLDVLDGEEQIFNNMKIVFGGEE